MTLHKPELLCPAGSPAAFDAAIEGGADAIYLGGATFNARIGAKNFTPEELRAAISRAHAYGVKVYLTLNTLVWDREAADHLRAAELAYRHGADAVIVADLGAAAAIHAYLPELPLHASTQLSGHNAAAAQKLSELGFSRMVCAREMSAEDLRLFVKHSPLEAEVFVHGALCVCHSGQCLFSSLVGGRSGNRGECAQPCRLPYRRGKQESYPLSLRDLSLAEHIPALCDMGIASFKIEGRMKSPEYVRDVTRIWRRLIDEHRGATPQDMQQLARIFSRGGFTDGYYRKKIDSTMLGVRSAQDKEISRTAEPFAGLQKKIPLDMALTFRQDMPVSLSLPAHGVTVTAEAPQEARNAPMDRDALLRCITKLGGTPYEAANVEIHMDEGLMIPVSRLNALRRDALAQLTPSEKPSSVLPEGNPLPSPAQKRAPHRSAVFYCADRIPPSARDFFDRIYVPVEQFDGQCDGVLLPPVIMDTEKEEMEHLLLQAKKKGARHALLGNLGHLQAVTDAGLIPHGDFRLNIANRGSMQCIEALGFADAVLSPELTLPRIRDIGGRSAVTVYGRIPLMVTEKCIGKELGDCQACTSAQLKLTDRRGVQFPVLRTWKHRSTVCNSLPVYMGDRKDDLRRANALMEHFIFTVESQKEIERILRCYQSASPLPCQVTRIR